jgi:hypothetical protein
MDVRCRHGDVQSQDAPIARGLYLFFLQEKADMIPSKIAQFLFDW